MIRNGATGFLETRDSFRPIGPGSLIQVLFSSKSSFFSSNNFATMGGQSNGIVQGNHPTEIVRETAVISVKNPK